jgi:signal transduction histidine kinase
VHSPLGSERSRPAAWRGVRACRGSESDAAWDAAPAFTNIVKHARAKTITVQTGFTDQHVFINVADDGCGFTAGREGRGLISMRRRAQTLGARLDIAPSSAGTTLSLYIPKSS